MLIPEIHHLTLFLQLYIDDGMSDTAGAIITHHVFHGNKKKTKTFGGKPHLCLTELRAEIS